MVATAALGIGSNLGDRLAHLQAAIDALAATDGVEIFAVSGVYETDPVGGPEQDKFLNAVVLVESAIEVEALLRRCQAIEAERNRVREVRWGPRTLDIDILVYGEMASDDASLTLPHPRAAERAFVLVPWRDVEPNRQVAGLGSVSELAGSVDSSGVRPRADLLLSVPRSVR